MIFTEQQAAKILGYSSYEESPAERIDIILPAIDDYIRSATGKDWGIDNPIDPTAKLLANVLLTKWFDHPDMIGKADDIGTLTLIGQLHAKFLQALQEVTV